MGDFNETTDHYQVRILQRQAHMFKVSVEPKNQHGRTDVCIGITMSEDISWEGSVSV